MRYLPSFFRTRTTFDDQSDLDRLMILLKMRSYSSIMGGGMRQCRYLNGMLLSRSILCFTNVVNPMYVSLMVKMFWYWRIKSLPWIISDNSVSFGTVIIKSNRSGCRFSGSGSRCFNDVLVVTFNMCTDMVSHWFKLKVVSDEQCQGR